MSFHLQSVFEELGGGGGLVHLDFNVSSGPFLTMNFEFNQEHGPRPGPKLDNNNDIAPAKDEYFAKKMFITFQHKIAN